MKRRSENNSSGTTLQKRTKRRPGVSRILAQLRSQKVLLTDSRDIRAYLEKHTRLARHVPAICERAREEFGSGTELELSVYRDIESRDRTLTLYIRRASYDPVPFMQRVDQVSREFDDALYRTSGFLLLTTDFRPPKGRNGIV